MIDRRNFLKMAVGAVAGITGWKLAGCNEDKPDCIEVVLEEVLEHNDDPHTARRVLKFTDNKLNFGAESVGATVQIEREYMDGTKEEFWVRVVSVTELSTTKN